MTHRLSTTHRDSNGDAFHILTPPVRFLGEAKLGMCIRKRLLKILVDAFAVARVVGRRAERADDVGTRAVKYD